MLASNYYAQKFQMFLKWNISSKCLHGGLVLCKLWTITLKRGLGTVMRYLRVTLALKLSLGHLKILYVHDVFTDFSMMSA